VKMLPKNNSMLLLRKILSASEFHFAWMKFSLKAILLCCLILLNGVNAAPYAPGGLPINWLQPDGTVLNLRVFGDEYYARTTTEDGYTVLFDVTDNAYYYAETDVASQNLIASKKKAHLRPPKGLKKNLQQRQDIIVSISSANLKKYASDRAAKWSKQIEVAQQRRARDSAGKPFAGPDRPPAGNSIDGPQQVLTATAAAVTATSPVHLAILVQFPDDPQPDAGAVSFPTTQSKISNLFNQIGYSEDSNTGSVRDYFLHQSAGLYEPQHAVTPILTLANPRNFYNWSDYPTNTVLRSQPAAARLMLQDAVAQLLAANFDFSGLETDQNQIVSTSLLFAGPNSGVWPKGLWEHQWWLGQNKINVGDAQNPLYINGYQITPMPNAAPYIGTIAHELGHLLFSFPDLYDTNKGNGASYGLGFHALMSSGGWVNDGRSPAPISLPLKDTIGWANIIEVEHIATHVGTVNTYGNQGYRIQRPFLAHEYFMVEYRGAADPWQEYVPDSGLMIWHVDESVSHNQNQQMTEAEHYMVSLEQADGLFDLENANGGGDAGDLFDDVLTPVLDDNTTPDAQWWSGRSSGIVIEGLTVPGGSSMDVRIVANLTYGPDTDGDGLYDDFETAYGFDPNVAGEDALDSDNDGLYNLGEQAALTDPWDSDSDDDGINDQVEVSIGTNPLAVETCDVDSIAGASIGDLLLLQRHLAGLHLLAGPAVGKCDLTHDGQLNVSDLLLLEQSLAIY
jgi:M6 family metalloprotease-like protein